MGEDYCGQVECETYYCSTRDVKDISSMVSYSWGEIVNCGKIMFPDCVVALTKLSYLFVTYATHVVAA